MDTHVTFVEKVGRVILQCKGIETLDYMSTISQFGQPFDEIAIALMARMYHVHVAVMQDKFYWTTKWDHDVAACKIILGWKGNLNFIDIKWKENQEVPVYNLQSAKYPPANIDAPESPGHKMIPREPSPEKEQWYNLRSNKNNPPNPPVKGDDPAKGDDPPSRPSLQKQDGTKKMIGTVTFRSVHLK